MLRFITVYLPQPPRWVDSRTRGGQAISGYGDCTSCGGPVEEQLIEYNYRREHRLMVISNVPAGGCAQCEEKYFKAEVLKKMDSLYHHCNFADGSLLFDRIL